MTIAEVRLWGSRIGAVVWNVADRIGAFEYDVQFQASGIQPSPLKMPLGPEIYQFPGLGKDAFNGLPGMVADSLPDRYGNALIDAWLSRQGRAPASFDPVERLCYIGTRGMGALEYHPAQGPDASSADLDVAALVELADAVLAERTALEADMKYGEEAVNQILQVGTSAGGARAKAVIAWNPDTQTIRSGQEGLELGFSHWVLKFDGVRSISDREVGTALGYGLIEYAYYEMARRAGIEMTECRILKEGGRHHFMTRRFDRTDDGDKLHMQSLGALAHFDYNAAGAYSYEQAVEVMRRLRLPQPEIEQQFRRTVFNVVARNQDDHVKNVAFLMDRAGRWSLSPAFDITYAYNPGGTWTHEHQMSLNGKRDGFTANDLLEFGRFCNLKAAQSGRVVSEVVSAVDGWTEIASEAGISPDRIEEVRRNHRMALG